jgi:hypothetical protein
MTATEERLLKELKAMRLAIRKMKAGCNEFDEAFSIRKDALSRVNKTLKEFRQPVALTLPN